jgi:hypothetical protein
MSMLMMDLILGSNPGMSYTLLQLLDGFFVDEVLLAG